MDSPASGAAAYATVKQIGNNAAGRQDGWNWGQFAYDAVSYYAASGVGGTASGVKQVAITATTKAAVDHGFSQATDGKYGQDFTWENYLTSFATSAIAPQSGGAKSDGIWTTVGKKLGNSVSSGLVNDTIRRNTYGSYDADKETGLNFLERTLQSTSTSLANDLGEAVAKSTLQPYHGDEAGTRRYDAIKKEQAQPDWIDSTLDFLGIIDLPTTVEQPKNALTAEQKANEELGKNTKLLNLRTAQAAIGDDPGSRSDVAVLGRQGLFSSETTQGALEAEARLEGAIANGLGLNAGEQASPFGLDFTDPAEFDQFASENFTGQNEVGANQITQAELAAMSPKELARYASYQNFKAAIEGNGVGLSQEYLNANASLPTGTASALNPIESYFTFNKVGQFQKGFGDTILDTPEVSLNVAEEAILTVGDVGVASYKGITGESDTFNAQSRIGQIYQEKGAVSGSLNLLGSLVTAPLSPVKSIYNGNYNEIGQAAGGLTVGLGALKLKQGYDNTFDSLSAGFNIDGNRLYQGTSNQIGLIPDVILSNESIRFSQSSVSSRTSEGQFLLDLTDNIATNGFNPDYPLTTIRLPDYGLTSFDNRRLLSSDAAGATPYINIFDFDSPIPLDRFKNLKIEDREFQSSFSDIASQRTFQKGSAISTWGEAAILRGINQTAPKSREGIAFDVYGSKDLPVITSTRLEADRFDTEGARYLESLKRSGILNSRRTY